MSDLVKLIIYLSFISLQPHPDSGWLIPYPIVATEKSIRYDSGQLYIITGYSCSAAEGTEACVSRHTGQRPKEGSRDSYGTVASNSLPPGTRIWIDGLDVFGVVEDTGGELVGRQIDVYREKYSKALAVGRSERMVYVEREQP